MANIPQHQPLRRPANWTGQEASLIVQLESLMNDLYRLIGLLQEKADKLDKRVTALEDEEE